MGLLRTAARTAVITSTATRVHARTAERQRGRWATPQQAAPPPQAPPPQEPLPAPPVQTAAAAPVDTATMIEQLRQLGELRTAGVLTDAEFEAQKARVLGGA